METAAVSDREKFCPKRVKKDCVLSMPCRRIRMLTAAPEDRMMMSRVSDEGKSAFVGSRGSFGTRLW